MSYGGFLTGNPFGKSGRWNVFNVYRGLPFQPIVASGGDLVSNIEIDGVTYRVHSFTTVGTSSLVVASVGEVDEVECLVVAGGGSGGFYNANGAGGGGAGGLLEGTMSLASTSYPVVVGAGGASRTSNSNGANGGNSSFNLAVALGGGGGGSSTAGLSGGSGGGGGNNAAGGVKTQDNSGGLTGYGNNGAASGDGGAGGGGGGAGGAGGLTGPLSPIRVNGGIGRSSSITGSPVTYATGGSYIFTLRPATPQSGAPNTGNGGQSDFQIVSGAGGSGIVIIRYPITDPN